jgi:hypothetical protein
VSDQRKRAARVIMTETGWNYTRALREADRRHATPEAPESRETGPRADGDPVGPVLDGAALTIEAEVAGRAGWTLVGAVRSGQRPGSISQNTAAGREAILFYCQGLTGYVCRSRGQTGLDLEGGLRVVECSDLDQLAVLEPGQTFELDVTSDRGVRWRARWTNTGGAASG